MKNARRRYIYQHTFLDIEGQDPTVIRGFVHGKPTLSDEFVNTFSVPHFLESAWALYNFEEKLFNTNWSQCFYGGGHNSELSLQIATHVISRYSKFLILCQKYPNDILIPTHDIEICRQCQIIRPLPSREDNNELEMFLDIAELQNDPLQRTIYEPQLTSKILYERLQRTAQLWMQEYNERYTYLPIADNCQEDTHVPHMYYFDSPPHIDAEFFSYWSEWLKSQSMSPFISNLQPHEFVQDRMWYVWFRQYMQKTCGFIMSPALMKKCLKMYEKFLWIISKYVPDGEDPDLDGIIAPSFPIDLIWHTHMNNPASYDIDCQNLLRMTGPCEHIPWPCAFEEIIRIHNSSDSYESDSVLWVKEFGKKMDEDHIPE